MVENPCRRWGYKQGTPLGLYCQGITEPITMEERRDHEGLGHNWQPCKDGYQRKRNRKMIIPLGLANFVSAGILDPNLSEATTQATLLSGPPMPLEEWVNIEEWYSDEE